MAKFTQIAGIDEQDAKSYRCSCDFLSYKQGEIIFTQNSSPKGIYCIQSGHAMLWHMDEIGNEIGFRVAGSGELIGHRAYFGEDVHAATAVALTNCIVCCHHPAMLKMLLGKYPVISGLFLRLLACDRGPPDSLLLRNTHLPVHVRLVNLLLILKQQFAKKTNNGDLVFNLPLYRREISTMIAARPETVARAIKELEKSNIAYFKGRTVTIPDEELLTAAAYERHDD